MKVEVRSTTAQGHFRLGAYIGNAWQEMDVTQAQYTELLKDKRLEVRVWEEELDAQQILHKVQGHEDAVGEE